VSLPSTSVTVEEEEQIQIRNSICGRSRADAEEEEQMLTSDSFRGG